MAYLMTNGLFVDIMKTGPENIDYICCDAGQTINLSKWNYKLYATTECKFHVYCK